MTCLYIASPFYKIVTISVQPFICMSTSCVTNWVPRTLVLMICVSSLNNYIWTTWFSWCSLFAIRVPIVSHVLVGWTKTFTHLLGLPNKCVKVFNVHTWGNAYVITSLHININIARHEPYKYSIRKQKLSISHCVAMSNMSNLHHNCNIWITPNIIKELLMALWPSMNTCREGSPLSLEFKMIEY